MTDDIAPESMCPECGEPVCADRGFVPWCPACEWNLSGVDSATAAQPKRRAIRRADKIAASAMSGNRDPSAWQRLLAVLLALPVHGLTMLIGLLAALVLVLTVPNVFGLVGAALLGGLAYVLRPRVGNINAIPHCVQRHGAPELFAVLDEIASALSAPAVAAVVLSGHFNASYRSVGWRRRGVIDIGEPMWWILSPQERAAVLSHELAHRVNGDATRGMVVGSAIGTLTEWDRLLRPSTGARRRITRSIPELFADVTMAALAATVRGYQRLIRALLVRSSARAEYRADDLAASVAGTDATVSALDRFCTQPLVQGVIRTVAFKKDVPMWPHLRRVVDALPPTQVDRLRRLASRRGDRSDDSHPPTRRRIEVARSKHHDARVTLDAARSQRIDDELLSERDRVERTVRNIITMY